MRQKLYSINILSFRVKTTAHHALLNISGILSGVVLALLSLNYIFIAMENASLFTGYPADGIFQLFNPLRRLGAGQVAGHDFQFFFGLGTLFLHYPIYWLAGSNLSAAELSLWLVSPILFFLSAGIIFWAITKKWQITLLFTAILALLSPILFSSLLLEPGNSYIGVRSVMPLFVFAALLLWKPSARSTIKSIVVGVLLALCFFISTEHGMAIISGYLIATIVFYPRTSLLERSKEACITLGSTVVSLLGIYLITSGRYLFEPLHYALLDVPADQFWFFGGPPSRILSSVGDFFADPGIVMIYVVLLILLGVFAYKARIKRDYKLYVILFSLLYGLFSTVGALANYGQGYTEALLRVEVILLLGLAFYNWKTLTSNWLSGYRAMLFYGIALVAVVLIGTHYIIKDAEAAPHALSMWEHKDGNKFGTKLSTQWTNDMATTMKALGSYRGEIWSEYAGLPEAELNTFQPSGYDYIIHALGSERRQGYIKSFDSTRPEYVITMRDDTFVPWQNWLENEDWDFFERVANNYTLVGTTSYSNIWRKNNNTWITNSTERWKTAPVANPVARLGIFNKGGVVEVKLNYSIKNPLTTLPVIGSLSRYLVTPEVGGKTMLAVSLPPYMRTMAFPIYVQGVSNVDLKTSITNGYLGSNLVIKSIQFRMLDTATAKELVE